MNFLDRTHELAMLERRWRTGEAQIFTVWGRRRVGKTLLLLEFARGKRHLYFEATSGSRADQLEDFSDRLADATERAALRAPNWRAGLDAVADWAEQGPVLVVLDEFQYIARESADVESVINVWWRERGQHLPIFLILCGSEVGFFEREVVNYSATTYGRRSGQLRLQPFAPEDVGLFVPGWSAEDKVATYAVFGHMPYYLGQLRERESLSDNILHLVLQPDGLLHEEARLLLDQELREASAYFSVLRALAAGRTRVSQIAERTQLSGGSSRISQMLEVLARLWLVERTVPVTVTNPERSRLTRYRITDPYLRFWFRFVLPAQGRLSNPVDAARYLKTRVEPELDRFVSTPAFEEVCQRWLRREADAAVVGWWWGRVRERNRDSVQDVDRELDAVAIDDDGRVTAVGSCKWTSGVFPLSEKAKLDALAYHLAPDGPPPDLYVFSRHGFAKSVVEEAATSTRLHLIRPAQLFGATADT